jgi:hypothetical protein
MLLPALLARAESAKAQNGRNFAGSRLDFTAARRYIRRTFSAGGELRFVGRLPGPTSFGDDGSSLDQWGLTNEAQTLLVTLAG